MSSSASALVIDKGQRVLFRIKGRIYELSQQELRNLLELPAGPPGLGITVDRDQYHFEFAEDNQTAKLSAAQLQRRLNKPSVRNKARAPS